MTSLAFIRAWFRWSVSSGAGAEMRRTLGAAVFSGMLGVTLFGIFLTPVFYYVIQWVGDRRLGQTSSVMCRIVDLTHGTASFRPG